MLPNFDYVESNVVQPCWHCGAMTNRVEINFETNICSVECYAIKEADYWAQERLAIQHISEWTREFPEEG